LLNLRHKVASSVLVLLITLSGHCRADSVSDENDDNGVADQDTKVKAKADKRTDNDNNEVDPYGYDDDGIGEIDERALDIEPYDYKIVRVDNPDNPCDRGEDKYNYEKSWYDDTQIYINSRLCEPALWFDNFFATDRLIEEGVPGTYIRLRNDFTFDEEDGFDFNVGLSVSVELPGLQHKLRLTYTDEDEQLREISPNAEQPANNSLGLQLKVKENIRSSLNLSITLTPRIRLRYRYNYPLNETINLRWTQELQRESQIDSARTQFDFEKVLNESLLFRSTSSGEVSEAYDGVDWVQGFVLFQRINKKSSLSYQASAQGITEPMSLTTNYRIAVRYRRNFHRPWLFYEIVPANTWPVTLDDDRETILKDRRSKWIMFFRLEIHFGNEADRNYSDYN
jgi:hypothetical protein